MYTTAGKPEDKPAVYRSEAKLAALGAFAHAGNVIKYPFQLCSRKICVDEQSRAAADILAQFPASYVITVFRGTAALPHYRVIYRLAGASFPYDSGLTLVCDTNAPDILCGHAGAQQRLARHGKLCIPYVARVVLDPSVMRKMLREFLLRGRDYSSRKIENYRP